MKQYIYILLFSLVFGANSLLAQNSSCTDPDPFCASFATQSFGINAGGSDASITNPGNDYGCLSSSPRPSWFYLNIQNPGNLDMHMTGYDASGSPVDVDFILYGPFANLPTAVGGCNNYGNGGSGASILDCSYSNSPDEDINIVGATSGQVYILLVTGYSAASSSYTLAQTGGSASTNCSSVNTGNCGETVYDIGGASGDYINNMDVTTTFCPSAPGGTVTLNFTAFSTENCCDHLYIYDGNSTAAPLLGTYQGTGSPGSISSTAGGGGCITIRFVTDGSIVAAGYAFNVICNPPPAVCGISTIVFGAPSACNDNGTPSNATDDFYTVDITVNYTNRPVTGNLVLSGGASASVAVGATGLTNYTFANVQFPADGTAAAITATFSATPACTLTNASGPTVSSCSSAVPCTPNNGTWN